MQVQPDRKVPARVLLIPLRKFMEGSARRFIDEYVNGDMVVLDVGSGPGFFSIELSKKVGPKGLVYAVDADKDAIDMLTKRVQKLSINNVVPRLASADNMDFIRDGSIDAVFSNKTLCCVRQHSRAIKEVERVLKAGGIAYVSVSRPALDDLSVDDKEFRSLLSHFTIMKQGSSLATRWAIVRKS